MHEAKGVKFVLNASPQEFRTNEAGALTHVVVDGDALEADVCVLGIGVEPSTGFLVDRHVSMTVEKAQSFCLAPVTYRSHSPTQALKNLRDNAAKTI
jgi:hypothetical protein